jgi:hypothetical protein
LVHPPSSLSLSRPLVLCVQTDRGQAGGQTSYLLFGVINGAIFLPGTQLTMHACHGILKRGPPTGDLLHEYGATVNKTKNNHELTLSLERAPAICILSLVDLIYSNDTSPLATGLDWTGLDHEETVLDPALWCLLHPAGVWCGKGRA